jgi:hypothetical protein
LCGGELHGAFLISCFCVRTVRSFDNRLKASLVQPGLLDIIRYPCKYGRDGKNIPHEKSYNETKQIYRYRYCVILFKPYLIHHPIQSNSVQQILSYPILSYPIQSNKSSPMNFKIQSNLLFNPTLIIPRTAS